MNTNGWGRFQFIFRRWIIYGAGMSVVVLLSMFSGVIVLFTDATNEPHSERLRQSVSHFPDSLWKLWVGWSLPGVVDRGVIGLEQWYVTLHGLRVVVREWTSVDWRDGRSVLAAEMPWLQEQTGQLLWGQAAHFAPQEMEPSIDLRLQSRSDLVPPLQPIPKPVTTPKQGQPSAKDPVRLRNLPIESKVLIYHTHNRESWLPELPRVKLADLAYDANMNVTLLGRRLQKRLAEQGVSSIHKHPDYPSEVEAFQYARSYRYSAQTIQRVVTEHEDVRYFFDIHRDSQKRKHTTLVVDGKAYAQIYLIIGKKNPRWKENMRFAREIHEALERKIPGLSKGVWGKGNHGNGEYNQSVAAESVLVEIGGVENTLTESNRTVDVLGRVIAQIVLEHQRQAAETLKDRTNQPKATVPKGGAAN
jgi:stage II sporulation protein P